MPVYEAGRIVQVSGSGPGWDQLSECARWTPSKEAAYQQARDAYLAAAADLGRHRERWMKWADEYPGENPFAEPVDPVAGVVTAEELSSAIEALAQ